MIEENFDEDELTPDTHPPELTKQKTDDQLMSKSMKEKRKESLSSPNEFNIQRQRGYTEVDPEFFEGLNDVKETDLDMELDTLQVAFKWMSFANPKS